MHANQFWWAWPPQFQRFCPFLLAFKNGQISLSDHGLQSIRVKKQNRLKKFMQVKVDVKCMQTNFGGCGILGFEDFAPFLLAFENVRISLSDHGLLQSMGVKKQSWLKKFMQVEVDVTCMYNNFGGHGVFGFGDTTTLKNGQISLSDHGLQSMVIKKFNRSELAQKN